jgi:hypothetical protein
VRKATLIIAKLDRRACNVAFIVTLMQTGAELFRSFGQVSVDRGVTVALGGSGPSYHEARFLSGCPLSPFHFM